MEPSPPLKRMRFSCEPDLDIEIEGEIVRANSTTLMMASKVFASMLGSDLSEGLTGRIKLPEKKRADFGLVMLHIDLRGGAAPPQINADSVEVLLRWSDEYDMGGLKSRCQEFLADSNYTDHDELALTLSLEFGFKDVSKSLSKYFASKLYERRDIICKFVDEPIMMEAILPKVNAMFELESEGCDSLSKTAFQLVIKMIEAKNKLPGKMQREYYVKRANALTKKLTSLIPALKSGGMFGLMSNLSEHDHDKMVSFEHLKCKCTEGFAAGEMRCDVDELKAMLAHLVDRGKIYKSEKSGKYYRQKSTSLGDSDSD